MPKKIDEIPLVGINLNRDGNTPLYTQLYNFFKEAILAKRFRGGQKLPGTRSLATALHISRNTVSLAFEQLMIEGYIEGKTGSGSYVSENIPDHHLPVLKNGSNQLHTSTPETNKNNYLNSLNLTRRYVSKDRIIPFQSGTPSLMDFPLDLWNKTINTIFKNINPGELGYGESAGFEPLRMALAEYLRTYRAVRCEKEQILIVNGSQQALNLTSKVLLNNKSTVWIEDPGYLGARAALMLTGADIYPVPIDENGLDLDYAIRNYPKPDVVYTTPSHQYPLGYTMSISRRLQLLEWSRKNKVWIIEDDYDSEYRYAGNPLPALQGLNTGSGIIYMGTFSKVLFPGLRLGYMVLPNPKVTDLFLAAKSISDRQNAILEQMITANFIQNGHFTKHIRKMRLLYKERQEFLIDEINRLPGDKIQIEKCDAGMHLIAWLPARYDDREIKLLAQNRGLIVNSLTEHAMHLPIKPGIILGYTAFNEVSISEGVQKLADVLEEYEKDAVNS